MRTEKSLRHILIETFPNSKIPTDYSDLKIGDLKEWDSLGNFNLLLAIEEEYKIRFDIEEMSSLKSVDDIQESLRKRS